MGYNGLMLHPCQGLCVELWGIGSKLLAWQEKEMSVLASFLMALPEKDRRAVLRMLDSMTKAKHVDAKTG